MQIGSNFIGQIGKLLIGSLPDNLEAIENITVCLMSLSGLDLKDSISKA
ncbi:hypothetical protein [Photobacterium phosphoreum]|nr:hypothetical protein [Photobacterium phosphoreum]